MKKHLRNDKAIKPNEKSIISNFVGDKLSAMGRKAGASSEIAIAVISEFIDHFRTDNLPAWSSNIWDLMSASCIAKGGTWSRQNIYTHVRENRRCDLQKAREQFGIFLNSKGPDISLNSSNEHDASTYYDDANDKDFELELEAEGLDTFQILIKTEEWRTMQGDSAQHSGKTNRCNLLKDVWQYKLSNLIYSQTRLQCGYVFHGINVYKDPSSMHFLRIKGQCKSKECSNPLFAYLYEDPGDSDFLLTVRTRNTIFSKHEQVHRPLRGVIRERIGKEVFHEGCSNWRRRQVGESTELGNQIPPTIPKLRTLHQSKTNFVDKQLDVHPKDGTDVIHTILRMQNSAKYTTSILDSNPRPFFVSYSAPSQRHSYQRFQQLFRDHTTVGINGSSAGIKRIIREDGTKSGFLFLYQIVMHFDETIMPIHQMITESQHTNTFDRCLRVWITPPKGLPKLPKPRQLICDDSRALLNGCCLALNDQTIHTYVQTCFMFASHHPHYSTRPPIHTLIRLDVFHLLKMVRKWDGVKKLPLKTVQNFYIYCMALLYDCQTLSAFEEVLSLVFSIGLHEYQDQKIMTVGGGTVRDARRTLENLIAERNEDFFKKDVIFEESEEEESKKLWEDDSTETMENPIRDWVKKVLAKASVKEGSLRAADPNAFYAPAFIESLTKLSYEFPLWTGVGLPFYFPHGTTSYNEGYFNLWKHNERKNYSKSMRADKCIKLHIKNCEDQSRIFESKLTNFISKGQPVQSTTLKKERVKRKHCEDNKQQTDHSKKNVQSSPISIHTTSSDSDSDAMDNWRNKGNEPKLKKMEKQFNSTEEPLKYQNPPDILKKSTGVYFTANPEIGFQNDLLRNVRNGWVLQNGGKLNAINIDGQSYFIINTCHYDALVQILMCMAFDNDKYKGVLTKEKNATLHLIDGLIDNGLSSKVYQERGKILKDLFNDRIVISRQTKYRILSYEINTINNCTDTWTRMFRNFPSVLITHDCPNCELQFDSRGTVSVNHNNISKRGFQALDEELLNYFETKSDQRCSLCKESACTTSISSNYLIHIELDIRSPNDLKSSKKAKLRDFPKQVTIDDVRYRLTGIVGFMPQARHYVAYCRRANDKWQVFNDLEIDIGKCSGETETEPHAAIYIVEDFDESYWYPEPEVEKENSQNFDTGNFNPEYSFNFSNIIPSSVEVSSEKTVEDGKMFPGHSLEDEISQHFEDNLINDDDSVVDNTQEDVKSKNCEENTLFTANISGRIYSIEKSSNFDCLLQILAAAGSECIGYRREMKLWNNKVLRLVENYLQKGLTNEFYVERALILKEKFPEKIYPTNTLELENRIINLQGDLTEIWEKCMENTPSVYKDYDCNNCNSFVVPISYLKPDNDKFQPKMLKNLNKLLDIHLKLDNVKCLQCSKPCTMTLIYNYHVFVKLSSTDKQNRWRKCKLKEISPTLNLQCSYRLSNIAAYCAGEYQAFHRDLNNNWFVLLNSFTGPIECSDDTVITPHAALYILET